RADGPLEGDAVPADRFQGARGQGVSLRGFRVAADEDLFPGERRARRVEDRQDGVGDFGADAVAADQRDRLRIRIRGAQWASRFSGATGATGATGKVGRIILIFRIAIGVASSITK